MECKKWIWMFCFLLSPAYACANIYFTQEKNGTASFSDIPSGQATKLDISNKRYRYRVNLQRVIDGDTIVLESGEKVRFIGVNTPEIESRFHQAQAGGETAKKWLEQRLQHHQIYLEYDEEQYDKYERLLAHVYIDNQDYLNAELLEQGLAVLALTPPNLEHTELLQQAQVQAEKAKRGLWALDVYQLQPQQALMNPSAKGWQRWLVKVKAIKKTRKYIRLMITENAYIAIAREYIKLFPDLKNYQNKTLEVRGWLSHQQKQSVIQVMHPSAILVRE